MDRLAFAGGGALIKRIVGVDISKNQTGICRMDVIIGSGPHYEADKFKVQALGTNATVAAWADQIRAQLNVPCDPAIVVYELPVIVQVTNMIVYQLSGVLLHMCIQRRIPIIGVHNQTLKRWAGVGQGEKPISYGMALTGRPKLTSDECDAAVLCEIGYYIANEDTDPGTDIKREIVRKLRMTEEEKQDAARSSALAKAAATIAADAAMKQKAIIAAERAQAIAHRQAELQRRREEKAAKKGVIL